MAMQRPFRPPDRLKGPEHIWSAMRAQSPYGFTVTTIHGATSGTSRSTVKHYVRWCLAQGLIVKIGEKSTIANQTTHIYSVEKDAPVTAPVQRRAEYTGERGRVQEHLWTAMRALPAFGVAELAFAASTEEHPVKPRTAESYIRDLAAAGVLIVLTPYRKGAKGRPGARAGKWRLKPSRNSGPKPLKASKGRIFDPNTGQWLGAPKPKAGGDEE